MVNLVPVPRALIPVDSAAAGRVSAPNYDEFQGDQEVFDLLAARPECVLRVTMAHCDVPGFEERLEDGSAKALGKAAKNMQTLRHSPLMRVAEDILWVYEIVSSKRPDVRQLGIGGIARTNEIRTESNPSGVIIRNEGIRQKKVDGRARLIEATKSYVGTVNCAVPDTDGRLVAALEQFADSRAPDFATDDEAGNTHRVWIVTQADDQDCMQQLLEEEPAAYVADGNHRSAAAAALGRDHFLAVFFPTDRLRLEPYNRLVHAGGIAGSDLLRRLESRFDVEPVGDQPKFRPECIHEYGLYTSGSWHRVCPKPETYDPHNAAGSIDAEIIQRHIFEAILGIDDPRDERLNFVGGNKDSAYLKSRVDSGEYDFALSLAPVTMEQFVAVCEQNQFMPPKSTWFDPKIRSGLVIALLD